VQRISIAGNANQRASGTSRSARSMPGGGIKALGATGRQAFDVRQTFRACFVHAARDRLVSDAFAQMSWIGDEVADVTDAGRHSARARGLDRPATASNEFVIEQGDIVGAGCNEPRVRPDHQGKCRGHYVSAVDGREQRRIREHEQIGDFAQLRGLSRPYGDATGETLLHSRKTYYGKYLQGPTSKHIVVGVRFLQS
jgi:hypothetical protein